MNALALIVEGDERCHELAPGRAARLLLAEQFGVTRETVEEWFTKVREGSEARAR